MNIINAENEANQKNPYYSVDPDSGDIIDDCDCDFCNEDILELIEEETEEVNPDPKYLLIPNLEELEQMYENGYITAQEFEDRYMSNRAFYEKLSNSKISQNNDDVSEVINTQYGVFEEQDITDLICKSPEEEQDYEDFDWLIWLEEIGKISPQAYINAYNKHIKYIGEENAAAIGKAPIVMKRNK